MPEVNFEGDSNLCLHGEFEHQEDNDEVEPKTEHEFLRIIEEECLDVPDKEEAEHR